MAETSRKVRVDSDPSSQNRRRSRRSYAWIPPVGAVLLLLAVLLSLLYAFEGRSPGGQGGSHGAVGASSDGGDGTGNAATQGSADHGQVEGSGAGNVLSDSDPDTPGTSEDGQDQITTPNAPETDADGGGAPPTPTPPAPESEPADAGASTRQTQDEPPLPDVLGFQSNPLAPAPAVEPEPAGPAKVSRSGSATPGIASFFGQAGRGSRFVYIIDRSGSMKGGRFDAARFELIKSIRSLGEHESFYVIFYDSKAQPMPAPGLLTASESNQQRMIDWLRTVSVGGGTDPTEALTYALTKLKPDTIWLLSDGAFSAGVSETVKRLNPKAQVQINTIAFHNRGGETLLRIIADENDGDYQYVGN